MCPKSGSLTLRFSLNSNSLTPPLGSLMSTYPNISQTYFVMFIFSPKLLTCSALYLSEQHLQSLSCSGPTLWILLWLFFSSHMLCLSISKSCYLYLQNAPHSNHLSPPLLPPLSGPSHLTLNNDNASPQPVSRLLFLLPNPMSILNTTARAILWKHENCYPKETLTRQRALEILLSVLEKNWKQPVNGQISCLTLLWESIRNRGK